MIKNVYSLATGKAGKSRLDAIDHYYGPATRLLLQKAKLSKGLNILECGCGVGHVTRRLSKVVGKTGHIFAFDIDPQQIALAQQTLSPKTYSNVTFFISDVYAKLPFRYYDAIYGRFIFSHLKEPKKAITHLLRYLKPGGLFILEEPIISSAKCIPLNIWFIKHINIYQKLWNSKGANCDLGNSILDLFSMLSLQPIEINFYQRFSNDASIKKLAALRFKGIKESIIKLGLMSETEFNKMLKNLSTIIHDPSYLFSLARICQGIFKKFE